MNCLSVSVLLQWCLCLAVVIPLATGCDKGKSSTSSENQAAPAGKAPLVYKLTPEQFAAEFKTSQPSTDQKYQNGVIEMAGVIEEIGVNLAGNSYVNLRAGPETPATKDAPAEKPVVQCQTTDPEPWAKLARGQEVTLRGSVGYLPIQPNIKDCEILSSGAPTVIVMPAAQLAAEYAQGRDAFIQKYTGKNLIVSGEVTNKKPDLTGAITLLVKGDGAVPVECAFGMIESVIKKDVSAVAVGKQVKIFCEVDPARHTSDAAPLTACRLITK